MRLIELDDKLTNVRPLRAQLDVLFLLAEAVHDHRAELLSAARANTDGRTWVRYVRELASTFADPGEVRYLRERSDALLVLDRFQRSGVVRTSAAPLIDAVGHLRRSLEAKVQSDADPLRYLARANERAHGSIAAFLGEHRIVSDLPGDPALVRLTYSSVPGDFCAVSSRLVHEIVWNVGPTELAFWSAIQPELILRHEYLSHFAPRHPGLSSSVREGWLMDALIDELDRTSGPERVFDVGAFTYLRDHAEGSPSQYSNPGARELPYRIRRTNVELYWDMTRAIVSLQPGEIDRVGRIDELLDGLVELSRTELEDMIEKGRWTGFHGLLDELTR